MPLLWLSLAFLAGILLATWVSLPAGAWLLLTGAALALPVLLSWLRARLAAAPGQARLLGEAAAPAWLSLGRRPSLTLSLLPFFLLLGAFRCQSTRPAFGPQDLAAYNDGGEEARVQGVLVDPPDRRDGYSLLKLRAEELRLPGLEPRRVGGLLLVYDEANGDWRYGDRLAAQGRLEAPPEGEEFSYRDYLAQQGVYSRMTSARLERLESGQGNPFRAAVYALRERALEEIYRLWPDPEASLLAGILLGVESGISEEVQQAFRDTGTAHIIAISGFNITIVAGLFGWAFTRLLGRYKGAAAAALGVAGYTLLVGAGPSVVRAALMGGLALLGAQVGRRSLGLNSLALVAALMALANPLILWNAGFQLSFFATLGLVVYGEPLCRAFAGLAARRLPAAWVRWLARPVSEYLLFTLAAQAATLPILAYHFGRLSLVSLVANPAILPLQPAVMVASGAAVLAGLLWAPLGRLAAGLAWPFAAYTIRAVEGFAAWPGGALEIGPLGAPEVAAGYAALFLATLAAPRARKLAASLPPAVGLAVLGGAAALAWHGWQAAPDGRLHLTLLAVSAGGHSGEALLIRTPGGRHVLMGGGPSSSRLSTAVGRRLPLFSRRLDYLVVGNPRQEEIGGLPQAIRGFPPAEVLWAGEAGASPAAGALREALAEAGIPLVEAAAGQSLELGEGGSLQVLAAGKLGGVFLLEWRNFRALLPLGIGFEDFSALDDGRAIGPVSALLLADHGYAPANPPGWIAHLRPQVVLLGVAAGDREGLPSAETLEAVQGYTLLRTDRNGWIELSTDGEQLWVEVERR